MRYQTGPMSGIFPVRGKVSPYRWLPLPGNHSKRESGAFDSARLHTSLFVVFFVVFQDAFLGVIS